MGAYLAYLVFFFALFFGLPIYLIIRGIRALGPTGMLGPPTPPRSPSPTSRPRPSSGVTGSACGLRSWCGRDWGA